MSLLAVIYTLFCPVQVRTTYRIHRCHLIRPRVATSARDRVKRCAAPVERTATGKKPIPNPDRIGFATLLRLPAAAAHQRPAKTCGRPAPDMVDAMYSQPATTSHHHQPPPPRAPSPPNVNRNFHRGRCASHYARLDAIHPSASSLVPGRAHACDALLAICHNISLRYVCVCVCVWWNSASPRCQIG